MSTICYHPAESDWTGPTPEAIMAAHGQQGVFIRLTNRRTGEEVWCEVKAAYLAHVGCGASFEGVLLDGRQLSLGHVCGSHVHTDCLYEFELSDQQPVLAIVA